MFRCRKQFCNAVWVAINTQSWGYLGKATVRRRQAGYSGGAGPPPEAALSADLMRMWWPFELGSACGPSIRLQSIATRFYTAAGFLGTPQVWVI